MATQTRNPTSDVSFTGTWTGAPRWSAVDDHPDSGNPVADSITHGTTTAGEGLFGFTAFSVPAGSTAISVQVLYYDFKNASQACNIRARIRCNDATGRDAPGGTHNPGNGNANIALRTDDYGANNPKTGSAWTVDDVNGVGTNGLTAFGVVSTDANPSITISSIQLQVTYTPPSTPYSAALSAPAFGISGQSLTRLNDYITQLTSAGFTFTAQSLTRLNDWVGSLSAPTFTFTGQDLTWANILGFTASLTAASFAMTAQTINRFNDYLVELSSATLSLTNQALTWFQDTVMNLSAAAFSFVGRALGYTEGAVDLYQWIIYKPITRACKRMWNRINGPGSPY